MEIWDIYNKMREKTGKTIVRGEKLEENEYHLVVHVWIVNRKGDFLIQKRSSKVKSNPNIWAVTGGAAIAGDDSYKACEREVIEEIGIKADMTNAQVVFTIMKNDSISDVWLIKQDFEIADCKLQLEEVSDAKWATRQEIVEMIEHGKFHSYQYIKDIFQVAEEKYQLK
ncbi:NUDIX domain-containing protein [Bacillus sp. CGMCC 1.16607]|uniref:NUDIX hydrolase n=1 Tax=Bacillus sp. CGMCC 1.16607 TaxID=3351842 RepID=UPI003642E3C1